METLSFGPKLTQQQYEKFVIELHSAPRPEGLSPKDEEARKRRIEQHIMVDYRLGMDFPQARRNELWAAKQKWEKKRGWYLILGFLTRPTDPGGALVRSLVRAFGTVLTRQELQAFFDLNDEDAEKVLP